MPLLASVHDQVLDMDLNIKLTTQDVLIELGDAAISPGFRRTYVLHYSIGPESAERIDPVALQPQDFVHEWIIRPSEEMHSRSSEAGVKWHKFLHGDRPKCPKSASIRRMTVPVKHRRLIMTSSRRCSRRNS